MSSSEQKQAPMLSQRTFRHALDVLLFLGSILSVYLLTPNPITVDNFRTVKSGKVIRWEAELTPYAGLFPRTADTPEASSLAFISVNKTELELVERWMNSVGLGDPPHLGEIHVKYAWDDPQAAVKFAAVMSRFPHDPMVDSSGDWVIELPRTPKGWLILSDLTQSSLVDVFRDWDLRIVGTQQGWNVWIPHRHWDGYSRYFLAVLMKRDPEASATKKPMPCPPPGPAGPAGYEPKSPLNNGNWA